MEGKRQLLRSKVISLTYIQNIQELEVKGKPGAPLNPKIGLLSSSLFFCAWRGCKKAARRSCECMQRVCCPGPASEDGGDDDNGPARGHGDGEGASSPRARMTSCSWCLQRAVGNGGVARTRSRAPHGQHTREGPGWFNLPSDTA